MMTIFFDTFLHNFNYLIAIALVISFIVSVYYLVIKSTLLFNESNSNFKKFFETIDDLVIVGNKQGKIIYTNAAVSNKLGYSPEELHTMYVLDLNPKKQRKEAEEIFKKMLMGTQEFCPLPLERKNGTLLPSETRIWFGKWDNNDCIFGLSKDLTYEQEVLQKFNKVFENNPALMAISSLEDRRFTDVNEAFLLKTGFSRDEVIGKTSQELNLFIHPEKLQDTTERLLKEGRIQDTELRLQTKLGAILDGEFSGEIIESQGKKYFLTVMIDQTKNKLIENKIIENEKRLESILEGTQVGTWEWNVKTGEARFNERWARIIGYSLEELSPISIKTWEQYVYPEDLKKSDELLQQHFDGQLPYYDCELRMKHKNGTIVWVHDRGRVVTRDKEGSPLMMYGTHTDISERKKILTQQALLSEISVQLNQYDNFHITMNDILKKIGIHTQSSRSYIFEDSLDGRTTSNTFEWCTSNVEPQIDRLQNILYNTIPSFATAFRESGMLQADDVSKLSVELRNILEPQGIKSILILPLKVKMKQIGFIGFDQIEKNTKWSKSDIQLLEVISNSIASIYERRNSTIEIKEQFEVISKEKNKIETIIRDIEDGVFVVDKELNISLFNPKASNISGHSVEDALGKPYFDILHLVSGKLSVQNDTFIKQAIMTGNTQNTADNMMLITKNGIKIAIEGSASPLQDNKGNIVGCVGVFRDVTQERKINTMKSEFISIASHQLKTPLVGIKWLSELLLGNIIDVVNEKQKKYINYIHYSNERMLKLVDDLLNISQIEAGEGYTIKKEDLNLTVMINEVLEENNALISEKNLTVILDKNSPQNVIVSGDKNKLKQAVNNLVNNAVKYSHKNTNVEIGYTTEKGNVLFKIQDYGIGIPRDLQNRIFEKFFRADNAVIQETDGTGLGVYIAKQIIEAHGGKVWFESIDKIGSTFYMSLPIKGSF